MAKTTIHITGMHCAACAQTIQNGLIKLKGVTKANVNFASQKALVEFNEVIISQEMLSATIKGLGYKASLNKGETDKGLKEKLLFSIVASIFIMFFSMQHMIFGTHILSPSMQHMIFGTHILSPSITNLILLILATPIQFWAGYQFHRGFLNALKNRSADMNTLISIGTNITYLYSVYLTLSNNAEASYYDTSAMIITIVLAGGFFEARATRKASLALSELIDLSPQEALVIRGGLEVKINVSEVKVGETVIVKPGERIATDGVVIEGASSVDEALITGESAFVDKKTGDNVFGGTINKTGMIKFIVDKPVSENTIAKIAQLLEDAQASKPSIQRLADTASKYFVPVVLLISVITFILWYYFATIPYAISRAISVLIVACPCALGLATPIAVVVFLRNTFRRGIIIKEAKILETLAKADTFAFDKTGTLTAGSLNVIDVIAIGEYHPPDLITFASSAEKYSEHPIAKAILTKCIYTPPDPEDFRAIPGFGVMAKVGGKNIILGNANLMEQHKISISSIGERVKELESQEKTLIFVAVANTLAGIITLQDTLKKESWQVIQWLKKNKVEVVMITGDSEASARAIAKEAGIDKVLSRLTPQDKVMAIRGLCAEEKIVTMVGDGINDAPALASANIGISIDAAADIAKSASDITLTGKNLNKIIEAIELSRKAVSTIKQNLWLAFAYNLLLIPLSAGVFYKFGFTLTPEISAVAMSLSSLTVVGNSIR